MAAPADGASQAGAGAEGAAAAKAGAEAAGGKGGEGFLGGEAAAAGADGAGAGVPSIFSGDVIEGGSFKEGWADQLREAGLERLANKGMLAKTPEQFLKTLDDNLGLVGKKQVAGYPGPEWSDADVAEFHRSAGVPDNAEAYQLMPEKMPEGVKYSDDELRGYAEIMHRGHVPEAVAKELAAFHVQREAEAVAASAAAFDERVNELAQASDKQYREEWGDGFESRLEANRAYVEMVFTPEERADPIVKAALSHPKIVAALDAQRLELRGTDGTGLPGAGHEAGNSVGPREQAREIMKKDPNWRRDTDKARKVLELYALDARQKARKGRA